MTGNRALLSDFASFRGPIVAFGDNARGQTQGAGNVSNGEIKLVDVSLVEQLKYNLISISQLCDKGMSVLFLKDKCLVMDKKQDRILLTGVRKGNVYVIDMSNAKALEPQSCFFSKATTDESALWHRRFAHLNYKNINKLAKLELVIGLPQKEYVCQGECSACMKGKQTHASHKPIVESSIMAPLHLLHMDLFGPIGVMSMGKKRYTLVVTDDYSRFTWVFFLHSKDETAGVLKPFITNIEKMNDGKVKIIRCDRGTEFKNTELDQFCEEKGIIRQYSAARSPQ